MGREEPRQRDVLRGESGSGGILALAVLALVTMLALAAIGLGAALAVHQRAIAAADSGALAAADTALGIHPGMPCAQAAAVVETYDANLTSCDLDGAVATVTVTVTVVGIVVTARARAGPPR